MGFLEIYDPKKRNEIVASYLESRKLHKAKNKQEQDELEQVEEDRREVFKPILDSNKKLQEEIIDEKNKIVETLNSFRGIVPRPPQPEIQDVEQRPKGVIVSRLIAGYLQEDKGKSQAGYSLRYGNNKYTIGNQDIEFDVNTIKIDGKEYNATPGLMELLTKKSPDLTLVGDYETRAYRDILACSNALYQGFSRDSKKYNADPSAKWKFIKEHYFVPKASGSSIDFLPANPNALIEMLQLSIGSYQAGNKNEYNKIHRILDELVRQKKIKKKDLGVIYVNIGF